MGKISSLCFCDRKGARCLLSDGAVRRGAGICTPTIVHNFFSQQMSGRQGRRGQGWAASVGGKDGFGGVCSGGDVLFWQDGWLASRTVMQHNAAVSQPLRSDRRGLARPLGACGPRPAPPRPGDCPWLAARAASTLSCCFSRMWLREDQATQRREERRSRG